MKSSLIILIFFLLGCVGGLFYTADFDLHILSVDVLYLLMLLLGINLGCNQDLKGFVRQFSFKMLLVPIATVTGTFLFRPLPDSYSASGVFSTAWQWAADLPIIPFLPY